MFPSVRRLALRVAVVAALGFGGDAAAHPDIDEARRLFDAAEFDGALAALARAERSRSLARGDVVDLLEVRVLVSYALGRARESRAAEEQLAALDPEHRFPHGTNPDVLAHFTSIRRGRSGPVDVAVERRVAGDALELEARPLRAPAGLVQATVLHVRRDDGPWLAHESGHARVELVGAQPAIVAYRGDLVGIGGATLASTPTEVWKATVPAPAQEARPSRAVWYWGAAGALAVAAAVTLALVLAAPDTSNRPSPPTVDWP